MKVKTSLVIGGCMLGGLVVAANIDIQWQYMRYRTLPCYAQWLQKPDVKKNTDEYSMISKITDYSKKVELEDMKYESTLKNRVKEEK